MLLVSFDDSIVIHARTLDEGKSQQYFCFCGVDEGCSLCSAHRVVSNYTHNASYYKQTKFNHSASCYVNKYLIHSLGLFMLFYT